MIQYFGDIQPQNYEILREIANADKITILAFGVGIDLCVPLHRRSCSIGAIRFMQTEKLDFGHGKIGSLFRAMFFPTLVGMFFNSALNICDGMFVGHGVGPDALAAVNIVAPLFLVCVGIGLMFGIGASVVGSIRLSGNDVAGAGGVMTRAYLAGGILFGLIIVVCALMPRQVLYLFGCSGRLEPYAIDYLIWLLPGLLFLYLQCVGMMLIRLDGSPKYAMTVQIVAAVCNIFLDWLMVYPLDLGIAGAAIATAFSCIVAGLMVLYYFLKRSNKLKFTRLTITYEAFRSGMRSVSYMAKIGLATFISELAIGLTMVTGNYVFLERLGEAGVAAFSVGCYLFPLLFSISNAVAQSAQPIISFNYGASNHERVARTLKIALTTAVGCGLIALVAFITGSPALAGVFLPSDSEAFRLAVDGLPVFGLCTVFFAINITFIGYYQSIECAALSTFYTILRGVVFVVPAFVFLPCLVGIPGLWGAIPTAEILTSIVIVAVFVLSAYRRRGLRLS